MQEIVRSQIFQILTQLEPAGAQYFSKFLEEKLSDKFVCNSVYLYLKFPTSDFDSEKCILSTRPNSPLELFYILREIRRLSREAQIFIAHTPYAILSAISACFFVFQKPKIIAVFHNEDSLYPRFIQFLCRLSEKCGLISKSITVVSEQSNKGREFLPNPIPHSIKATSKCKCEVEENSILVVARLSPEKNLLTILKSLEYLNEYILNLVGSGIQETYIRKMVDKMGLQDRVRLMGSLPNSEVRHLMHKSSLLISASSSEGMPLTLLEGVAEGIPILVSDIKGHKFFVSQGVAQCFSTFSASELAEKIVEMKADPRSSNFLQNRERMKNLYGEDAIARHWIQITSNYH